MALVDVVVVNCVVALVVNDSAVVVDGAVEAIVACEVVVVVASVVVDRDVEVACVELDG